MEEQKAALEDAQLSVTETAAAKVREMAGKSNKPDHGLRIMVVPGGCSGFQYEMDFENAAKEDDVVTEISGVKFFVDKWSMKLLSGATVDYVESFQGAGFKVDNPNARHSCGCGNSFG